MRVRVDTGADRYFLTWGRLGSNDPWPGDIGRAVLEAAKRWAVGGLPISATVCDSIQEASGERYFYECLTAMQQAMPASGAEFSPWADRVSKAVLRGEELYYCGLPKPPDEPPDPDARIGFVLEWFDHDGHLVGEHELEGMTPEGLQELLGDPDLDRVMCLTHPVAGKILGAVVAGRNISVDEAAFDYVVSPWADRGYRTPGGYSPPPRVLPAFPGARKVEAPGEAPT